MPEETASPEPPAKLANEKDYPRKFILATGDTVVAITPFQWYWVMTMTTQLNTEWRKVERRDSVILAREQTIVAKDSIIKLKDEAIADRDTIIVKYQEATGIIIDIDDTQEELTKEQERRLRKQKWIDRTKWIVPTGIAAIEAALLLRFGLAP